MDKQIFGSPLVDEGETAFPLLSMLESLSTSGSGESRETEDAETTLLAEDPEESQGMLLSRLEELNSHDADQAKTSLDTQLEARDSLIGKVLCDRYAVIDSLNEGNLSKVYLAQDLKIEQLVAVKMLKSSDPDLSRIFADEVNKIRKFKHKNMISILDFGSFNGSFFYVMELIEAPKLTDLLQSIGRIETEEQVADSILQVCDLVSYLHKRNYCHGNLTEDSMLLIESDGKTEIKVGGFCTAPLSEGQVDSCTTSSITDSAIQKDIYQIGALAYRMVTGQLPFRTPDGFHANRLWSLAEFRPDFLSVDHLDRILMRCLASTDAKFESVDAVREDLLSWRDSERQEVSASPKKRRKTTGINLQKTLLDGRQYDANAKKIEFGHTPSHAQFILSKARLEPGASNSSSVAQTDIDDLSTINDQSAETLDINVPSLAIPDSGEPGDTGSSTIAAADAARKVSKPTVGDPLIGQVLSDRYAILEVAGKTDVAIVYAAKDLVVDRLVAAKTVISPEVKVRFAFATELAELETLKHPYMIEMVDFLDVDEKLFYMMEFIEAPTLADVLASAGHTETEEQIATTIQQICEVVDYLHQRRYAHGCLTPECIMLLEEDGQTRVKVGSFCTATLRAIVKDDAQLFRKLPSATAIQQYKMMSANFQNDIRGVAAIAYQMVTGEKPWRDEQITKPQSITLSRPDMFGIEYLDQVLAKALDPGGGYRTILDLWHDLSKWIELVREQMGTAIGVETKEEAHEPLKRWSKSMSGLKGMSEEEAREMSREFGDLKSTQAKGEDSFAMRFTKAIARIAGSRSSPLRSMTMLVVFVITVGCVSYQTVSYVGTNYKSLKQMFLSSSRHLANTDKGEVIVSASSVTMKQQFEYKQDPGYSRWTKNKEIGAARRIGTDGKLRSK